MPYKNYIIAEIGSVHDGSFGNACHLVDLAADCGADAVKFQTHIAEAETLKDAPSPSYFKGESRHVYFDRTGFNLDQWKEISKRCDDRGVDFMSSPFSLEAVDLLEKLEIKVYKIPSGEVSNIPLLAKISTLGKSVMLSSGMSTWPELENALAALKDVKDVILMQCSSVYPTPPEQIGLNILGEMKTRFPNVTLGYSDHTLGMAAPVAAAALGAQVIEKHLTFSKKMYGSDAKHSMEPDAFKQMVEGVREIWQALDNPVSKDDMASSLTDMKNIFEKSIVLSGAVQKGQTLSEEHLAFKKPGDGIAAAQYKDLVGLTVVQDLPENHMLCWEDLK